jgi:hypothetical protein
MTWHQGQDCSQTMLQNQQHEQQQQHGIMQLQAPGQSFSPGNVACLAKLLDYNQAGRLTAPSHLLELSTCRSLTQQHDISKVL